LKEDRQIDLYIDSEPSANDDLKKWIAFIEKYLVYGLEQKGIKMNILKFLPEAKEEVIKNPNLLYLPVFTKNSSRLFLEHVRNFYESMKQILLIKVGLIKDGGISDTCNVMLPELKLIKMYLIDTDNGKEVGEAELWKKEHFNLLLFKIVDLCNEIDLELKSLLPTVELNGGTKSVYLAETTPDLIFVREEVRRELLRQGFEVYPKKPISGNSKEVEKTILELLQKSVLSIHLFGKLFQEGKQGEAPRAELENRIAANFYLAKKESKKQSNTTFRRIIWLPDNLVVNNENQVKLLEAIQKDKKLYAGSDIIRSSVEELKDIILEKLTEKLLKMAGIMIVQKKLASMKDALRTD
jgi:hypothetical protein